MNYGHSAPTGGNTSSPTSRTPSPWINYIYNGRYFATISANGGGISYFKSPLHGRITRYRINDVPPDRPGKYIYVKDLDSGELWSLTWQPVGREPRRPTGSPTASATPGPRPRSRASPRPSLFFVPPDDDREIWRARLTQRERAGRAACPSSATSNSPSATPWSTSSTSATTSTSTGSISTAACNALFATKTYWVTETRGTQQQENKEWDQWAFFTVNAPVAAYETLRERFIGPYRNEIESRWRWRAGRLGSQDTDFGNAVGALQVELELGPRRNARPHLLARRHPQGGVRGRSATPVWPDTATPRPSTRPLAEIGRGWDDFLRAGPGPRRPTPRPTSSSTAGRPTRPRSPSTSAGWPASIIGASAAASATATRPRTRSPSSSPTRPRPGSGSASWPGRCRADGKVYHHFYGDGQGEFTKHCDDPLWFILAVDEYVKETGDFGLLDESEPFLDGGAGIDPRPPPGRRPLRPRQRRRATACRSSAAATGTTPSTTSAARTAARASGAACSTRPCSTGWLGCSKRPGAERSAGRGPIAARDQFRRGRRRRTAGTASGTSGPSARTTAASARSENTLREDLHQHPELGGHRRPARPATAWSRPWTAPSASSTAPYGPKICAPAFREIDPKIGLITRCVWGKKENGAVFCHPTAWLIQAECLLGRGAPGLRTITRSSCRTASTPTRYVAEPYVYSQYITSDEHEGAGRASHSWQTGTAAWMYRVAYDHILGVRPTYAGLLIDPVIPPEWKSYRSSASSAGRGTSSRSRIRTASSPGVKAVIVDGRPIEGPSCPSHPAPNAASASSWARGNGGSPSGSRDVTPHLRQRLRTIGCELARKRRRSGRPRRIRCVRNGHVQVR